VAPNQTKPSMEITHIPFSQLPMLAKMDRAYAEQDPALKPFQKYPFDIAAFKDVINDKAKAHIDRQTLMATLKRQYKGSNSQIESLLNTHTFTVTTAHQPSLFTGPLYFIYKIFSTINLAKTLKTAYPDYHFVPVFVIGGEDHDFEEVNYINIFNKKLTWQRSDNEGGAVGMMRTESLRPMLDELKPVLGDNENAKHIFQIIEKSYTENAVYQDATQDLLIQLFTQYGLVVLNMNDADLKRLFIPIMKKEIVEQPSKALVEKTQNQLAALGFKSQAFPREINLFYLRDNLRERIVFENGIYKALNTNFQWDSTEAILKELETTPQYFSPNVVTRPLFQESILPNLAYIGGGGELAYWLERKTQFEHFNVNFPILVRRNSALFLDKGSKDRLAKLNLQLTDLTEDTDGLIKKYVAQISDNPLSMEAEKAEIEKVFSKILTQAVAIDPTLEKVVLAEKTKTLQSVEIIESKLMKAEKQKNETTINQIRNLTQKFFPNGGLQERFDNFLPYYLKYGDAFFDVLNENLNPFDSGMVVLTE
jgi:bacillithiol synthase